MDFLKQKFIAAVIDTGPLPKPTGVDDASKLQTALSTVFLVLGAIALLVITIAGFMYTISHGDPKIIEQAKNAILYAVIGLVVSISAFAIVNFVAGRI
ncbi:MAG TPA: hypothetical protein VFT16_05430 [Candidatus Saccharimonadales bacterium]|nr:hypothetical protein [Candidatus Saccharimonadales bacterium]